MRQFAIGDRVTLKDTKYTFNGKNGTVVEYIVGGVCLVEVDGKLPPSRYDKGWACLEQGLVSFVPEEYTLHNRFSDDICEVMEESTIDGWWCECERIPLTRFHLPRCEQEELSDLTVYDMETKEIFFSLLWVVDDETLNALLKEME